MDINYLYKWVTNQLNSGIPKPEIIKNLISYAKLSREEAENYVNDPLYRENFKLSNAEETEQETKEEGILSEIAEIKDELKELQKQRDKTDWSWVYVLIGLAIGWLIWGFSGC